MTSIDGQLQIDHERGVIWFHSAETGATLLRICRLPRPIPDPTKEYGKELDVTFGYGVSWQQRRPHQKEQIR